MAESAKNDYTQTPRIRSHTVLSIPPRLFAPLSSLRHVRSVPQDTASSQAENEKLERVAHEYDALVTRRPRSTFSAQDVQSIVGPLLKERSVQQHEAIFERTLACSALSAVLTFTDLGANADNHGALLTHAHSM
jgi:hypothetical protein